MDRIVSVLKKPHIARNFSFIFLLICFTVSCTFPLVEDFAGGNNNARLAYSQSPATPEEPIVQLFSISGLTKPENHTDSDYRFNTHLDDKGNADATDDVSYVKGYVINDQSFDAIVIPVSMKTDGEACGLLKLESIKFSYVKDVYTYPNIGDTNVTTDDFDAAVTPDTQLKESGNVVLKSDFTYLYGSNSWRNRSYISAGLAAGETGFFVIPFNRVEDISNFQSYFTAPVLTSQADFDLYNSDGGEYTAYTVTASAVFSPSQDDFEAPLVSAIPVDFDGTDSAFTISVSNTHAGQKSVPDLALSALFLYSLDGDDIIPKYVTLFPAKLSSISTEDGMIAPGSVATVTLTLEELPNVACEYAHPYFSYTQFMD